LLRRDTTRSNPSQYSLKIFLEVFRQVETSHALLYCIGEEQSTDKLAKEW
jgi:hypothetical protein